jgi:hypothetical protein
MAGAIAAPGPGVLDVVTNCNHITFKFPVHRRDWQDISGAAHSSTRGSARKSTRTQSAAMAHSHPLRTLLLLLAARPCLAALSDFTRLPATDVTPCVPPCTRVGQCGNYAPNPNGACNITWLAEQCSATYGCVAFNSNGWLKGCGAWLLVSLGDGGVALKGAGRALTAPPLSPPTPLLAPPRPSLDLRQATLAAG